jgi:hypothetical protein
MVYDGMSIANSGTALDCSACKSELQVQAAEEEHHALLYIFFSNCTGCHWQKKLLDSYLYLPHYSDGPHHQVDILSLIL